jgi:hypothetical protein
VKGRSDDELVGGKKGWFFEIYEESEGELMTNLMEHGACTLDISDEESEKRKRDERGKENVPPVDHASQPDTASDEASRALDAPRATRREKAEAKGEMDGVRSPLGDLCREEYYAPGLAEDDVVLIHDDEAEVSNVPQVPTFDFSVECPVGKGKAKVIESDSAVSAGAEKP